MTTKKVGRPPWVPTEDTLKQVEQLASLGMTQQQIADALGIGISTLMDKKHEFEEFAEAIKTGKAKGIATVTAALRENIKNRNVASILFYLKCQANWVEAKPDESDAEKSLMQELIDKL